MVAVALCLVVGGGLLLGQDRPAAGGPAAGGPADHAQATATRSLLHDLGRLFRGRSRVSIDGLTAGDPAARRALVRVTANAGRLRLRGVRLQAVGRPLPSTRGWTQDVQVSWRLGGVDQRSTTAPVRLLLRAAGDGAAFVSVQRSSSVDAPDWLTGTVRVARAGRVLAVAPTTDAARTLLGQAQQAARTVRRTLPRWQGPLVVEGQSGPEAFRRAAGVSREDTAALAAVTGSAGSGTRGPVHVFVNREVLVTLGPVAQEIVLSHEAAHVALGAATSSLPSWLVEGMADHVALAHVDLPDRVLAAQVAALVRERGLPRRLPRSSSLDAADPDAGAWYEASWLAVRDLAERHGLPALLRFYRASDRDGSTRGHFRAQLGTTRAETVTAWRRVLRALARDDVSSRSQTPVPG